MCISTVAQEARIHSGFTQTGLASRVRVSEKTISAFECGRPVSPAIVREVVKELDNYTVAMEAAIEATNGMAGTPYLDGDAADLHPSVVLDKTIEELREALTALEAMRGATTKKPEYATEKDLAAVDEAQHQAVEAVTALNTFIGVSCKVYKRSPAKLVRDHWAELEAKGYRKPHRR